jgi:nucleolar MIF4G domain-containing protein 1
MAHDPLRVTLDDLHSADTRGKWWLVGAAWSGDPLVERQESSKRALDTRDEDVLESSLLKLAKKQGMNTDIRRSIFVVLMSSEVSALKLVFTNSLTNYRIMSMLVNVSPS